MSVKYEEIFDYAKKYGLELTGFSYEMIINGNVTDSMEDYIVQIEIPIRSQAAPVTANPAPFPSDNAE